MTNEYKIVRTWKDGRILIRQESQSGLFGHSTPSEDTNRFLLSPDGSYKAHIWNGFTGKRGNLEYEGKTYTFAGYY